MPFKCEPARKKVKAEATKSRAAACPTGSDSEAAEVKVEVLPSSTVKSPSVSSSSTTSSQVKGEKTYLESVSAHPFYDNSHSVLDVYSDGVFRDAKGTIVGMIFRNAIPEKAAADAAEVLRPAATKTSLRSNIYGGQAPNSGIAGYFDYRGSPIEYKSRKTSFTHSHASSWPGVFPMVDYVNAMYKRFLPEHWAAQNACIPDVVRIHGSVFSTLTINSRFRTASHTDAGDFDGGYGCISCLEGEFRGLALTFDKFKVCFHMRPRDLVIFKTHHFHSNTELEDNAGPNHASWSRITCVFYYRSLLGEPWSYAEYQRRLSVALKMNLKPVVQRIVQKENGVYLNRPAEAYPEPFTPFILPCCVQPLRSCAAKALRVHQLLLENQSGKQQLAVLLFGEPLSTPNGIPERSLKEKMSAISAIPAYSSESFSEQFIDCPEKAKDLFRDECLSSSIPSDLFHIWNEVKQQWFVLLQGEWKLQFERAPDRVTFTWNNRSEMNSTFFEVCDAAKQIMIALFESDCVSKSCEIAFWGGFALYLHQLSHTQFGMPAEALTVQKLHVKLKDYHFGGTRYFKDMPPEEQKRRLERRKRLEEARLSGKASHDEVHHHKEWLENDSFDYQTEDCPVDYAALGLLLPEENTKRFDTFTTASVAAPEAEEPIYIVVVLPRGAPQGSIEEKSKHRLRVKNIQEQGRQLLEFSENTEYERLLGNAAAQEILNAETSVGSNSKSDCALLSTPPEPYKVANLTVSYVYAGDVIPSSSDFVILQHVLSTLSEEAAKNFVHDVSHQMKPGGCLMVIDTDFLCRNHYTILPTLKQLYEQAAPVAYGMLHAVRYGVTSLTIRSRHQIESILEGFTSRFKFAGSPLNSLLYLVPARQK